MDSGRTLAIVTSVLLLTATAPLLVSAHEGTYPLVLIPGWHGDGDGFREMIPQLEAQGFTVIDFEPGEPGTQALSYEPTADGQHIPYVAGKIVEEAIQDALVDNGFSETQKVDIIAHSMGGLVSRFLIEQPGADVDFWDDATGWYGDGTADVRTDWANRVDDLIMLGTPNHGTWEAWVPSNLGGFGKWNPTGGDMYPGSTFLDAMGYDEPAGETYHAIGGDPAYLQILSYDYDGDGVSHGFDGVVPAESPYVNGATMDFIQGHHGELLTEDAAIDLVIELLGQTSTVDGIGAANLAGDAVVRLEYLDIVQDHDSGGAGEWVIDVYVDPDGSQGSLDYTDVGQYTFSQDAPLTKNWGNNGPTFNAINLPGTSPVMDIKIVVTEDDTSWGGGYEQVSTHYLTNVMLSEDVDGMDYYEDQAADAKGGTNTVRASVNGITSDVADTRQVTLSLDSAKIKDDHDWGEGEITFYLNAGRLGFEASENRGEVGEDHYGRDSGEWVDVGTDALDGGSVPSEVIWNGRMLEDAILRFDVTYWEDDGGWSGADGGNMYYLEDSLTNIPEGETTYSGTTLPDFDAYLVVEKAPAGASTQSLAVRELQAKLDPMSLIPDGPDDPPGGPLYPAE
ncbi:MAG: hypothetical protein R3185_05890 [Candidatus Thermoplasmatota archaeon]|nr:hypothetical protein [Candidatus Thermoplasmatota archaeon]